MPPPRMIPPVRMELILGLDILYTLLIVVFCAIIYFKTKEIYDLTKHKGIQFFRSTFLFFAFSYLVRFAGMAAMFYSSILHIPLREILFRPNLVIFSLVTYFSYVAILSLVFSSFWKIKKTRFDWNLIIHAIAIFSTLIVFLTSSAKILIGLQFLLFIAAIVLININPKKKKNAFSSLHLTYYLLFVFWMLNLISFERGYLSIILNNAMNIVSIIIFSVITFRVNKRLGNGKKKG